MKQITFLVLCFFSIQFMFSQQISDSISDLADSKYREDQFYVSVTYNLLGQRPDGVSQSGFSSGFHLGFIRDMPINKRRNWAIGVGLGISSSSFNQNLLIDKEENGTYNYLVLDKNDIDYTKNKFAMYMVEMPIQLRWRTSTFEEYKFWRIYLGMNVGYVLYNSSKYRGDLGTIKNSGIDTFNNLQYGLNLSAGYNTWNIYVYYGLNSIFDGVNLNNQSIDMNAIKIGLIFYIL